MHLPAHLRIAVPILSVTTVLCVLFFLLSSLLGHSFVLVTATIIVLLCLLIPVIYITIEAPLLQIQRAIESKNSSKLSHLTKSTSRFGQLARLVVMSFDQKERLDSEIYERIKSELKSVNTERQYRHLFETAQDAIITTTAEGVVTHCNTQAFKLFSVNIENRFVGTSLIRYYAGPPEASATGFLTSPGSATTLIDFECTLHTLDNRTFDAEIRLTPYTQEDNTVVALYHIRDITAKKAAEHDRKMIEQHLHTISKMEAISQLAATIGHEYNNIFGAISGYADLIKRHYAEDTRLQKYSQMLVSSSHRAADLTKKLLTFARRNKFTMTHFDAAKELRDIADLLQKTIPRTITLLRATQPDEAGIDGDKQQFSNAVLAVATNAIEAMPMGGTLSLNLFIVKNDTPSDIYPCLALPGTYLAIAVADTGCGMDKPVQSHLFEPFFTTKESKKNAGLGLASVKSVVEHHHGYIDVRSAPGQGSTITLFFPVAPALPPVNMQPATEIPLRKRWILAADDETFLQETLSDTLTLLGYSVTMCPDGTSTLATFSAHPDRYSLVILDMNMPGMNGLECFRKMKAIRPAIPVMIATGYCLDDDYDSIIEEGVLGIIQKPFLLEELEAAINAVFNNVPPAP